MSILEGLSSCLRFDSFLFHKSPSCLSYRIVPKEKRLLYPVKLLPEETIKTKKKVIDDKKKREEII